MTNKEWLDYLAHNAPDELAAWFDAERITNQAEMLHMPESHESATMQHIRQVIEDTVKRVVHSDTEPENADSRERLEADAKRYIEYAADYAYEDTLWADETFTLYDAIIELLDRQAAITEEKTRYKWVTASAEEIAAWRSKAEKLKEQVYELTAERDKLQEQLLIGWECECRLQAERDELKAEHERIVQELVDANTRQCERTNELTAERDNLAADLAECEAEREHYREKFGKCLDYADAIHALMDDEGMA